VGKRACFLNRAACCYLQQTPVSSEHTQNHQAVDMARGTQQWNARPQEPPSGRSFLKIYIKEGRPESGSTAGRAGSSSRQTTPTIPIHERKGSEGSEEQREQGERGRPVAEGRGREKEQGAGRSPLLQKSKVAPAHTQGDAPPGTPPVLYSSAQPPSPGGGVAVMQSMYVRVKRHMTTWFLRCEPSGRRPQAAPEDSRGSPRPAEARPRPARGTSWTTPALAKHKVRPGLWALWQLKIRGTLAEHKVGLHVSTLGCSCGHPAPSPR